MDYLLSFICHKGIGRVFLLSIFYFGVASAARCQVNISGKPGLLYVPDATYIKEGALRFGANYNPLNYALDRPGINSEVIFFANLTILPRLDINFNTLKTLPTPEHPVKYNDIGDRQLDIRYLLLKEKRLRPAVAVIMSSPFTISGAMLTHVVVATKTFKLNENWQTQLTAGLGSPYLVYRKGSVNTNYNLFSNLRWQKKSEYNPDSHYLIGAFGGIKLDFRQQAGLMLEYDSRHFNAGVYAKLFERWNVQAGLINFDQVTVGTAYSFQLLKPSRKLKKWVLDNQ